MGVRDAGTYPSPKLQTKGWLPSSGQSALLLNLEVSQMTSKNSWPMRTGCDAGHGPPDSKEPNSGYAMWAMWSGESRFTPSQQLSKFSSRAREGMRNAMGKDKAGVEMDMVCMTYVGKRTAVMMPALQG